MTTDLINIEVLKAPEVFMGKSPTLESHVKLLLAKAKAFKADVSTPGGRDECRTLAAKITRSKTALDGLGKEYLAKENERLSHINPLRKAMRDKLEQTAKDVRQPLTDWEEAEAEKGRIIQESLSELQGVVNVTDRSIQCLEDRLAEVKATVIDETWGKVKVQAELAKRNAIEHLTQTIECHKTHEKEQAELAAFREAKEKREQEEVAKQAEQARQEREAQIARDAAKEAEIKAQEAIAREEQAKQDRINGVKDAKEREERAEQNRIQAEKDAEERLERGKQAAATAERNRIEAERKAEADAEAKRAVDKKHFGAINTKAKDSLVALGLSSGAAKKAIEGIARGQVPNVTIRY